MRSIFKLVLAAAVLLFVSAFNLPQTSAATFTVINNLDDGPGSLRQAILDANSNPGADTITFSGDQTITISSNLPAITDDLTIDGSFFTVTISGNSSFRVFEVQNKFLTLQNLTVSNGQAHIGGGLYNQDGTVTLDNCTFTGNSVIHFGGAIFNSGTLTTSYCTFSGGSAENGGGIANYGTATISNCSFTGNSASYGGAVCNRNTASVIDCTFSGNSAEYGGGLYTFEASSTTLSNCTFTSNIASTAGGGVLIASGTITAENCTLSGNTASGGYGGGIFNGGTATVKNCTFSGNTASHGWGFWNNSASATLVNCIVWDENSVAGTSSNVSYSVVQGGYPGDGNTGTDPLLGSLGDYGGSVQTIPLLPGSSAIDAGNDLSCPDTDARGAARYGLHCDIGAFESGGFTLASLTGTPQSTTTNTSFALPLGLTVTANITGEPVDGGKITFTAPSSGASAALAANPVEIVLGSINAYATANSIAGSYTVTASASGANQVDFALTNVSTNADLSIIKTHSEEFEQRGTGTYTILVTNHGPAATAGIITVTDSLPPGLTATEWYGTGWTCNLTTLTASRSDALAEGGTYPALTLVVDIANNAPSTVVNTAVVTGGSDPDSDNNMSSDTVTILRRSSGGSKSTAAAPVISTGTAASITEVSAALTGNITTANGSIINYGFDYSISANNLTNSVTVGSDSLTSAFGSDISGLTPGTVYYYRAWATNSSGLKGYGTVLSFVTDKSSTDPITPSKPETPPGQVSMYTDLTPSHWSYDAVSEMVELGCISGYPDGTFQPDKVISRAEFVSTLVKALKLKAPGEGRGFGDTASHWAQDSISIAAALGIVSGYDDNTFKPDDSINREQMALMIVKAAHLQPVSGETAFIDAELISSWAQGSVVTVVESDFMQGYPDNTFRPQSKATRAEAVIVIRTLVK